MNSPTRPALRYHGGKWRLAPFVLEHFPEHERYVEPFCGAASILMRKKPVRSEIINDLCRDIVSFFEVLRDPGQSAELEKRVSLTPFAREEFDISFQQTECPIENARRLLVRSFMSYGSSGIYRRKTGFRSLCTSRNPSHLEWRDFPGAIQSFTRRLKGVVIENRDAMELIPRFDAPGTLFYVDPPYVHSTQRDQRHKYNFEMSDDDHRELAKLLRSVKGMVIVSGYPSELYNELYKGWQYISRAHVANCAKKTTECLWISPNAIVQPELEL